MLNENEIQTEEDILLDAFTVLGLQSENDVQKDVQKVGQLLAFVAMIHKWNKTYNLTALKKMPEMVSQHIIDSLAVIPNLNRYFQQKNIMSPKILDVGTGAGLPGVVLAIMQKNYNICCLDAVEKKIAFVTAVKGQIGLSNVVTKHSRVESLEPQKADIIISRAFASIVDMVALTQKHVRGSGSIVAMKANGVEQEIAALKQRFPQWTVKAVDTLKVPRNKASRCLVWLQKEQ